METADKMIPLADFTWPVTCRWTIGVPWGFTNMELTVDVPALELDFAATQKFVNELWRATIAPAMTILGSVVAGVGLCWKVGREVRNDGTQPAGEAGFLPLGKSRGIAVVMHTGHTDNRARRRLIFPAAPRGWADGSGQLSPDGAGRMITICRGLVGGLNGTVDSAPMNWLLPYPDAIVDPLTGFGTPGFRRVQSLRLCQYTIPVPDGSL